ncbi:MAG: protein-L-isoaspartate(D-aspartate) O-methyltransferase [Deltaproteobacteria bacterium]|nr:protein-L-isoaspartate(D-aspartate) O-methyltransferase [Deltaproteobacteria bacterium]MBW1909121.1 protein-L-isoaspartate(D-aspartate) O-methyltransferase [Deltaproteobacteria bacterium]MBW2033181.1 protein-L-isoaspartate(D-aspartate) O-methyltransferase [Deltaproteobacteria bacterium]MBW2115016.1 protein-L-isoaspartate(D-aspartate) O-methyltransferase [Deltaproteobacteria bacterium]MBW2167883.1 protein-L-isoaspartate(D-aspartate) O-methyltransferase [Deltaproteobacteria bacterium]
MRKISCFLVLYILVFALPQTIPALEPDDYTRLREHMVKQQIMARGVEEPRVLEAMRKVPRHLFVPEKYRAFSYRDHPLPIGQGQTISQPYIVAFMTEALDLKPDEKVLEIGTGSGYQAAILAELVKEVYTIEIVEKLGKRAQRTLEILGYKNIHVKIGDGYKGWPEKAPFDAVIVTCAPERIPEALVQQLNDGGRMIIPVGKAGAIQELVRAVKKKGKLKTNEVMRVRFVPMVKGHD